MTRLVEEDIETLIVNLKKYDGEIRQQTGMAMLDIAMHAVSLDTGFQNKRTAVVPVTSGLGIIDGFSDTVCGILKYCGIDAYVTQKTDVGGIQEAYQTGAELIFMADDDVCSAFSITDSVYSDNGYATGIGFAAALELSMRKQGADGEEVLILGLGPVGQAAALYLASRGFQVWVYDTQQSVSEQFALQHKGIQVLEDVREKGRFTYLYDATPVGNVIGLECVQEDTVVAAPGMPLGVTEAAREVATVIHNPLELGILTMYCECVKKQEERNGDLYGRYGKEGRTQTIYIQKPEFVSVN